jgi:hypothetical protein
VYLLLLVHEHSSGKTTRRLAISTSRRFPFMNQPFSHSKRLVATIKACSHESAESYPHDEPIARPRLSQGSWGGICALPARRHRPLPPQRTAQNLPIRPRRWRQIPKGFILSPLAAKLSHSLKLPPRRLVSSIPGSFCKFEHFSARLNPRVPLPCRP